MEVKRYGMVKTNSVREQTQEYILCLAQTRQE